MTKKKKLNHECSCGCEEIEKTEDGEIVEETDDEEIEVEVENDNEKKV